MTPRILVVDDQPNWLTTIRRIFAPGKYIVDTLDNSTEVLKTLRAHPYGCVLLDIKMPGISGLELLPKILAAHPTLPVIMVSGEGTIQMAVDAIQNGAYDFFVKDDDFDRLLVIIRRALERQALLEQNQMLSKERFKQYEIIGKSTAVQELMEQIRRVAKTDATVLITGESGTGKELVARNIYLHSQRAVQPFIAKNCTTTPAELLDSALFGHSKGSFTDAKKERSGLFRAANNGTLFLDEIGDMPVALQSKLLRAIENKEIETVGEDMPQSVNVRIIAATNQNLQDMISQGKFRRDLFYRLNVISLNVPPLRQRKEDILELIHYFYEKLRLGNSQRTFRLNRQAEAFLKNYHWPGNIRELKSFVERLFVQSRKTLIDESEAFNLLHAERSETARYSFDEIRPLQEMKEQFEQDYLKYVLSKMGWRKQDTATALGIDRANLFRKIQKYGLEENPN